MVRELIAVLFACLGLAAASCSRATPAPRTFATPEEAVKTLNDVVKAGKIDELVAIFGPDGQELVDCPIRPPPAETVRCSPSPLPSGGV